MKSLDPKDRPKLIALIAAAPLVFGYSVFQMSSYNSAQANMVAKAEAAKKVAQKNATPTPNAVAAGKPGSAASAAGVPGVPIIPSATAARLGTPGTPVAAPDTTTLAGALAALGPSALLPPAGGKDPFIPTGHYAEEQKPAATPAPTAPLPTVKLANLPSGGAGKETLPGGIGPFPGLMPGGIGAGAGGPVIVETPPPPVYTLTGIIVRDASDMGSAGPGDTGSIAVLHGGGGGTGTGASSSSSANARFVSVGDPVGNGYKVSAVRADAVDFKNGSHVVTLKMEAEYK